MLPDPTTLILTYLTLTAALLYLAYKNRIKPGKKTKALLLPTLLLLKILVSSQARHNQKQSHGKSRPNQAENSKHKT